MRIVFWGSGEFAVPGLQALIAAGIDISLVCTQPDRPSGRGCAVQATAVARAAEAAGIEVYKPTQLDNVEVKEKIAALQPQICVVVAYSKKIPTNLLSIPAHGFINAHSSLLPRYRGAAPVPWAILAGEKETGVTVFQLDEKWDTGPLFACLKTAISDNDTAGTVLQRLSLLAGKLLVKVIGDLEQRQELEMRVQDKNLACPAPKLKAEDALIDWNLEAIKINRQVRAFQPWPIAYTLVQAKKNKKRRLQILATEVLTFKAEPNCEWNSGSIIESDLQKCPVVACARGSALRLLRVRPEGKKTMSGAEYLRGRRLGVGQMLAAER